MENHQMQGPGSKFEHDTTCPEAVSYPLRGHPGVRMANSSRIL